MARLIVTAACTGCGACLLTCPTHALQPQGGRLTVRAPRCTECGECVEVCPVDAIELDGFGARQDGSGARQDGPGGRLGAAQPPDVGSGRALAGIAGIPPRTLCSASQEETPAVRIADDGCFLWGSRAKAVVGVVGVAGDEGRSGGAAAVVGVVGVAGDEGRSGSGTAAVGPVPG
ncbi:MAG TPA: 4Fe-4S dicluster domain-containing protein [Catenuloplanes sp.]